MSGGVPFLDLSRETAEVGDAVRVRVDAVLESGCFVLGSETEALEASMADLLGVREAVACSSGSDALLLALLALGIGRGDAVIVPAFTFFATAGAVARTGAVPVFADVDPATFNMEAPEALRCIEREFEPAGQGLRHKRSGAVLRALLPVHLYGRAVGMVALGEVATKYGLRLIEDAAQAIGARGDEAQVGAWGDAACFSFYPTKNLATAGDGGLVTTDDSSLASVLRSLRVHGAGGADYEHDRIGVNARMGEIQAAVVNAKVASLGGWNARRREAAAAYRAGLSGVEASVGLPAEPPAPAVHVYQQFVVRVAEAGGGEAQEASAEAAASSSRARRVGRRISRRDALCDALATRGIECRIFYPRPLHLQPCFAELAYAPGDLPVTERACGEVLCLPIHPWLRGDEIAAVCVGILESA